MIVGGLGLEGVVIELHGKQAEVDVRGKRLRAAAERSAGRSPARRRRRPACASTSTCSRARDSLSELNVIGCTVDEALTRLEKFLDESTVTDQRELRIVHGHGTGQLRRAIARVPEGASARRAVRARAAEPGRRRRDGCGTEGLSRALKFPQPFIDDLKQHADIVVVIQDYVSLKKTGATYKGLCPFHGEKTPSFHVNRDKGFFHCFGCGVGGDVFKFLELHEKIGFLDAVKQLAQRFGMPLPELEQSDEQRASAAERETLLKIHEVAAAWFRRAAGDAGRRRASASRWPTAACSDATAEAMGLGFAPPARDALKQALHRAGVLAGAAAARGARRAARRRSSRSTGSATG